MTQAAEQAAQAPDTTASVHPLVESNRVEGTPVYDPHDKRIGTIHHLIIEKVSGRVVYAVMSFGGFLGIGERYHPLPWSVLTYDPGQSGYVVPLAKERLQSGPAYNRDELTNDDNGWGQRVNDYYQVTPSWA